MAIVFNELKQYISRIEKVSICFRDGHYENYTLISDIPNGRYDRFYIYGIGMIDVEFPLDVYSKPTYIVPSRMPFKDNYYLGCGIEIALQDESRDITRTDSEKLTFGDMRNYLYSGRNFSVVMRENWQPKEYEYREEIPESYDELYVYGIGLDYNLKTVFEPRFVEKYGIKDSHQTKRMVIVLSHEPRGDIEKV